MTVATPYRLEIPSQPEYLTTARLFGGSVVRRHGDEATIDDVKLAISEAVSMLIAAGTEDDIITIEAAAGDAGLEFRVVGPPSAPDDQSGGPALMGMDLIAAIFPTLSIDRTAEATAVSFGVS